MVLHCTQARIYPRIITFAAVHLPAMHALRGGYAVGGALRRLSPPSRPARFLRILHARPGPVLLLQKTKSGGPMVGTFLRHGSNIWLALAVAALVVSFAAGVVPFYLLWALIGALAFYGSEYVFHRFAFHAGPSRFAFVRKLQHRLHYDHHAEPDRLDLLFLPVWFLIPNLAVTALMFALAFGSAVVASAMLGVTFAILHYEWVHYVAHIPYRPRTPIGRWIKQYHLRHHFISEKFWFGVSNPALDLLGGTFRQARDVARSATTRKLFGSPPIVIASARRRPSSGSKALRS
jgi:hypothetical protein